jgi:hypothetical protein
MTPMHKLGSLGGMIAASTFVVGLAMFATMFTDFTSATDAHDAVSFLVDNQLALYVWNIIITIVFGLAIVPFAIAIRDRLGSTSLSRVASVFGLIWSGVIIATGMITNIGYGTVAGLASSEPETARTVWITLDAVQNGLGGGNEVIGGVWVMLVSIAALATGMFPRWLNRLGVAMGVAGLLTVIPPLEDVGAIFGLGLIVWFAGIATQLRRAPVAVEV